MWYQFILQVHDVDDKKLIEGIHKFLLAHIGICYNILVGIVVYNYTTCPWLFYDFNYWDPHNTRIFFSEKGKKIFFILAMGGFFWLSERYQKSYIS